MEPANERRLISWIISQLKCIDAIDEGNSNDNAFTECLQKLYMQFPLDSRLKLRSNQTSIYQKKQVIQAQIDWVQRNVSAPTKKKTLLHDYQSMLSLFDALHSCDTTLIQRIKDISRLLEDRKKTFDEIRWLKNVILCAIDRDADSNPIQSQNNISTSDI
ncbi:hypothetical protein RFI_33689, partial [Reticulomyxa filosa]